ncbi:MAG: fructosamine kinase family protein [Amphritea sp.]
MPDLIPRSITRWLENNGLTLRAIDALSGGCVAQVRRLVLEDSNGQQQVVVLKQIAGAVQPVMFAAEAAGLQALNLKTSERGGDCCLRIPEVLLVDDDCLLIEYLPAAQRQSDFEQQLGYGLAMQHQQRADAFGFELDTFCGGTRQPNRWESDGYRFFAQQRLIQLAQLCVEQQRFGMADAGGVERIAQRLPLWIPEQSPALLHGDLWSGNVLSGPAGEPVLIDPAVYYGWPEAELAMTRLFGGFGEKFYAAYTEVRPLEAGWQSRIDLYNLYHYLNHLLLFGGGYLSDVRRIVKYYNG